MPALWLSMSAVIPVTSPVWQRIRVWLTLILQLPHHQHPHHPLPPYLQYNQLTPMLDQSSQPKTHRYRLAFWITWPEISRPLMKNCPLCEVVSAPSYSGMTLQKMFGISILLVAEPEGTLGTVCPIILRNNFKCVCDYIPSLPPSDNTQERNS